MIQFNQLSITPDGRHMIIDVSVKEKDFYKDVYLDEIVIDSHDTYTKGGHSSKPYLRRKFMWCDSLDKYKKCCALKINNAHVILPLGYIYKHTGEDIKPEVNVILGGELLKEDTDYTITYSNNKEIGTGTITIKGINQFNGERTKTFEIVDENAKPPFTINKPKSESTAKSDSTCDCEDAKEPEGFDPKDVKIKHGRVIIDWQDIIPPMFNSLFFVYIKTKGNPTSDTPCGQDNVWTMGVTCNLYPIYYSWICVMKELNNECEVPKHFVNQYLKYIALITSIKTGHYNKAIEIWTRWFMKHKHSPYHSHDAFPDIYPNHSYTYLDHPMRHTNPHDMHHALHHVHDYQAHNVDVEHHIHHMSYPTVELFGGPFRGDIGFFPPMPPIGGCNCGK